MMGRRDLRDLLGPKLEGVGTPSKMIGHGQRARFKRLVDHKNTGCTSENFDNLSLVMFVEWSVETYHSYLFRQVSD